MCKDCEVVMNVNPSIKIATSSLLAIYLCISGRIHAVDYDMRVHKKSRIIYMARPTETTLPCPPEGTATSETDQIEVHDAGDVVYIKEIVPGMNNGGLDFGPQPEP